MKAKIVPEKTNLHPRNLHKFGYDFEALTTCSPELKNHVFTNEYDTQTINFSNPEAVKALNNALLIAYYNIKNWGIPQDYLCPPIPGRADYLHYIADLLATTNNQIIPEGENVIGLDIGIGANCIYPIIGNAIYDWSFVGTDIDEKAIQNCKKIIENNPKLIDAISLQQQVESRFIFKNIILTDDKFAFTICNPPFHNSAAEATKSSARKVNNLQEIRTKNPVLNFGGQNTELWCDGGEIGFITQMIYESAKYPMQVLWFTTLVSKRENLSSIYKTLNKVSAVEIKTIDMAQGQKNSRIVAWTFLSELQQKAWTF
ncbi:23S rRNA (adenine(1618)-N(6))-methyltransferase RlmF [Flavobacterium psychrophilum]|uniref:23S rRNA (adenine(1618)-N(6))-methyltransferase RlmF n=1 Tax=Flavobacterium psychrophilum TaxID=96345 RepID=UPI0004F656B4|nr:23S rRNA (adenine(1618)-N(6))-methyltransferase RlmF [Flavobacterium psychrophilum]AIN74457.1 23S rRNA methyltransferase [Flavobacterium psychrophilum FPG3]EKT2068410.1 23S rRNA (adenine(1618)-N(6))-methyltransferase RlmF [Flavobacterium psychrophilum]EKT2071487.1 23S rRNA (adenine(1618)-N(6))-methyltransferase RlmF [Flavobacterium psychrophilum]EKT4491008.1 23S rRNA (adenine(1618)-N(6))-methyltransferase RlmF [Flavobacterium psychrophilum]EKT4548958.1 23S rRNA (adenine(1618)-N(6))-methyltr